MSKNVGERTRLVFRTPTAISEPRPPGRGACADAPGPLPYGRGSERPGGHLALAPGLPQWIDRVRQRRALDKLILDLNSSVS